MLNSIREFKNLAREPELRYRAIQILSTLIWLQDLSELNIVSQNSWEWNCIFKFRKDNESSNEIRMSVIDQKYDFK
jgi:hypothetical protein